MSQNDDNETTPFIAPEIESSDNPVEPENAETHTEMRPAVVAQMAECQRLLDGIDDLGFGCDTRSVVMRSESSALCALLVNKGLLSEEELQTEIYANVRQILANTLQTCEVQLAQMAPAQRAQHLAAAAARKATLEEAQKASQAKDDPVLQAASAPQQRHNKKPSSIATVRTRDQLLIARR